MDGARRQTCMFVVTRVSPLTRELETQLTGGSQVPGFQPRVADLIVECLEREGVTHVFGIPGEENIHLVDALSRSSIRFVLVRHEQGASFMAETYGRLTGKAGVCLATLGPGAINLLLGVADATTT